MIRQDFFKGGFPVCAVVPVICVDENFQVLVAYNKFDWVKILQQNNIQACHGIWPGKKVSDCFILDPKAYAQMLLPPEDHKEIDSASNITVYVNRATEFVKVAYLPKESDVIIESRNLLLYDYVKKSGIRYATAFE